MATGAALLALALLGNQATSQSEGIDSLVEAHESMLGLLRDVELRLEVRGEAFKPKAVGPTRVATLFWAWKGSMERIRHINDKAVPRKDGLTNNRGDVLLDGTTSRMLRNWDPQHPQKLTPPNQGTVRAQIAPQTRAVDGGDPKVNLLLAFKAIGSLDRLSLAQLVAESVPPAQLLDKRVIAGHECWCLRVHRAGIDGKPSGDNYLDIYLDPSVNFAARMLETEETLRVQAGDGFESVYVRFTSEVTKFKDCGEGVFFPLELETRFYEKKGDKEPRSKMQVVVSDLVVNRPLSADAFTFTFPENVHVVHLPAVKGRAKVELWGPNNQPVREIRGPSDVMQWQDTPVAAGNTTWWKLAAGIAFPVVAALVFLAWRRLHRRSLTPG